MKNLKEITVESVYIHMLVKLKLASVYSAIGEIVVDVCRHNDADVYRVDFGAYTLFCGPDHVLYVSEYS